MIYDSLTELIGGTPILRVKPLEGQVADLQKQLVIESLAAAADSGAARVIFWMPRRKAS